MNSFNANADSVSESAKSGNPIRSAPAPGVPSRSEPPLISQRTTGDTMHSQAGATFRGGTPHSAQHSSQGELDCATPESAQRTEWGRDILGREALSKGNLVDAVTHFQNELRQAKLSGSPERIAEAANDLAYVCTMTGSQNRAARLYQLALKNWGRMDGESALRSPRSIAAFALFLHDYAGHLTAMGNLELAAKVKTRLQVLARHYSAFTVYSALSNRLRCRGQAKEAAALLDLARRKPIDKQCAALTQGMLDRLKTCR